MNDGRKQVIFTYRGHQSDVRLILPFAHHLISVDVTSIVKIWVIREQGKVLFTLYFVYFNEHNDIMIEYSFGISSD